MPACWIDYQPVARKNPIVIATGTKPLSSRAAAAGGGFNSSPLPTVPQSAMTLLVREKRFVIATRWVTAKLNLVDAPVLSRRSPSLFRVEVGGSRSHIGDIDGNRVGDSFEMTDGSRREGIAAATEMVGMGCTWYIRHCTWSFAGAGTGDSPPAFSFSCQHPASVIPGGYTLRGSFCALAACQ
jgi:hypothetical protein